jgi:hypothetical protein
VEYTNNSIIINGDFGHDYSVHKLVINGEVFYLVPDEEPEEVSEEVMVENPFDIGDYVQVIVPKRPEHRLREVGKVIAFTPEHRWDNEMMPQVYVEFATIRSGCGAAEGRVLAGHGCRMPVSGLIKVS